MRYSFENHARRVCTAAVLAAMVWAPAIAAQKTALVPTRPKLEAGADTNDARSYYAYAMRTVYDKPAEAVRGFYWASQIDPTSGESLYGLHSASLLAMTPSEMAWYYDYFARSRSSTFLALDTLLFRVYTINPFLHPSFEHALLQRRIEAQTMARYSNVNQVALNVAILETMGDAINSPDVAFADGRLSDALRLYAKELEYRGWSKREHAYMSGGIHATRARIFYVLGNLDSARTEMVAALSSMHEWEADKKEIIILYRSKALYEQTLGMIDEKQNRPDSAREAYGQALEEDLAYYPAHTRMAQLQIATGDTAAALTELDLAAQLQPNNVVCHYTYAMTLAKVGKAAEAVAQLKRAIAIDPYYAAPHLLLARIADLEEYTDDAVGQYQQYSILAARADPELAFAKERIAKLSATVASTTTLAPAKP